MKSTLLPSENKWALHLAWTWKLLIWWDWHRNNQIYLTHDVKAIFPFQVPGAQLYPLWVMVPATITKTFGRVNSLMFLSSSPYLQKSSNSLFVFQIRIGSAGVGLILRFLLYCSHISILLNGTSQHVFDTGSSTWEECGLLEMLQISIQSACPNYSTTMGKDMPYSYRNLKDLERKYYYRFDPWQLKMS